MSNAQDADNQPNQNPGRDHGDSAEDQTRRPNALLVLGMHRSGTSVLARSLGLMGCKLPTNPMGPAEDNRTGFWEPVSIVRAHDELLRALDIAHDFPIDERIGGRDILEMIRAQGSESEWIDRLADCVRQEYGSVDPNECIVIKDPRMCRLVPLWMRVLESLGRTPAAVIPVRNPVEVAGSLRERNQFPSGKSYWLWMDHVLRAEHDTRSILRVAVRYESLIEDWRSQLHRVNDSLGLDFATFDQAEQIDRLVSDEHRHQVADARSLKNLPDLVRDTYEAACEAAESDGAIDSQQFDKLGSRFEQSRKLSADWILRSERRAHELSAEVTKLSASIQRSSIEHQGAINSHVATTRELRSQITSLQDQIENDRKRSHEQAMQSQKLAQRVESLKHELERSNAQIEKSQAQLKAVQQRTQSAERSKQQAEEKLIAERALSDQQHSTQRDLINDLRAQSQSMQSQLVGLKSLQDAHQLAILEQKRLNAYIDSVHQSGSWRITKPLRAVSIATKTSANKVKFTIARILERCGKLVKHSLPLSESMERRLESLFYGFTGPLLKHTAGYSNYKSKRNREQQRMTASMIEPTAKVPSASISAIDTDTANEQQGFDLDRVPEAMLLFGVIDWHFRHQRPQHIAAGMADRGHRVFYLSPQFVNQSEPGYVAEEITTDSSRQGAARVVQIRLHVKGSPLIYEGDLSKSQRDQIRTGISKVLIDFGVGQSVCMVQHPGWSPFAYDIPNAMLLYDCMDNHHGFAETGPALEQLEQRLLRDADLTVVTSDWLQEYAQPRARKTAMVRNACEYQHFADQDPRDIPKSFVGITPDRTVIGYYGAIAQWFDAELVARVAEHYPDALIVLIGADSDGVFEKLRKYANIMMLGEIPYRELPGYVARMDVCMIPFVLNDLIRATNPVKIYEMLAAGKPVVTTDLPELRVHEIDKLIHRATNDDEFVKLVGLSMSETDNKELVSKRQGYAEGQDWSARSVALDQELAALRAGTDPESLVSIVVVTWNNLDLTKACVESVLADTSYPNIELVIVDNASSDETPQYLQELDEREQRVRVILNDENTGFSKGNNIGLHACKGNFVVLLNNDTVVTQGWVRTMVNHLSRDESIGILGVITNNIGNEARVETQYESVEQMPREAYMLTRESLGDVFDIPVVAFFCCGMRREVYDQIGDLDENFGLGFFEDDDYCQRVRQLGLRVCCANDIFVHHHLSASFNKIGSSRKDRLFVKNKEYYESKWGTWVPHCERGKPGAVKATAR